MVEEDKSPHKQKLAEFQQMATQGQPGLVREFWDFLRYNKKWWLLPILLAILAIGALVFMAGSGMAPFIYTVF